MLEAIGALCAALLLACIGTAGISLFIVGILEVAAAIKRKR